MNEEAVKLAYDLFVKDGYKKDINSFKDLMQTNEEARGVAHDLFVQDGYKKGIADFSVLIGVDDVKKKDAAVQSTNATASSSAGTPSASSGSIDALPELNMNIGGASMQERFGAKAPKGAGPAPVTPPPTEQPLAAPVQQIKLGQEALAVNKADTEFKKAMVIAKADREKQMAEEEAVRKQEVSAINADPEFQKMLSTINKGTMTKTEEQLVPELTKKFGRFGFTFEETGQGDQIRVRSAKGEGEVIIRAGLKQIDSSPELINFIKEHATDYKKELTPLENSANDFYKSRGLDYVTEHRMYDDYVKTRDILNVIDSQKGKPKSDDKIVAKYPELFVNGRLRSDIGDIESRLTKKKDVLFGEVYGRDDVMKTREDWDLQLQKWSDESAKTAAVANANLKVKNQELSDYVKQTFGVSLDQINTIKPTTPEQQQALTNIKAMASEVQNLQNLSALKYETAKTFFNEKTDKSIAKDFDSNLSAVYNSFMDAANSQAAGKELIILKAKMISGMSDITDVEQAANIIAQANSQDSGMQSRVMTRKQFAQGFDEGLEVFKKDPIEYVTSVVASSMGQLLPYGTEILYTAMAGAVTQSSISAATAAPTVAGVAPAAIGGAVAGAAEGLTLGMSAANAAMEYTGALMDAITKHGYDLKDPQSVKKALQDPAVWEEGERIGVTRGLVIGTVNMITGGLAGNILHTGPLASKGAKVLTQVAERGIVDPLTEGAGELTAQFVSGQKISMSDVLDESIGSIGSNTPNMALNLMAQSMDNHNKNLAADLTNTAYLSTLKESNTKVMSWADNMKKLGKITEDTHKAISNNVAARQITDDILGSGAGSGDERMKVRVMDLVKAREELGNTPERAKIFSEEIGQINQEIKNTAKSNQIVSVEQQVDLDVLPLAKNKTKQNAVQESSTAQGVLRTGEPEVGLQEVGEGDTQKQAATQEGAQAEVVEPAIAATENNPPLTEQDMQSLEDEVSDFEKFLEQKQSAEPDFKVEDDIPSLDDNGDFVITWGKFKDMKFSETPQKFQQWLRTESWYAPHLNKLETEWKAARNMDVNAPMPNTTAAPVTTAPVTQAAPKVQAPKVESAPQVAPQATPKVEAPSKVKSLITQNGKSLSPDELKILLRKAKSGGFSTTDSPIEYNGVNTDIKQFVEDYNKTISPYNKESGKLNENYMKKSIQESLYKMPFTKFAKAFKEHINPYFSNKDYNTSESKFKEQAYYIINDGSFDVTEESYKNFAKAVGIQIPENIETTTKETSQQAPTKTEVAAEPVKTETKKDFYTTDEIKDKYPNLYKYISDENITNITYDIEKAKNLYVYISRRLSNKKNVIDKLNALIELEQLIKTLDNNQITITKQELLNRIDKSTYNTKQKEILSQFIQSIKSDKFPDTFLGDVGNKNSYANSLNVLNANSPNAFIHEFGHWGFYNLLPSEDRIEFYKYAIERFNNGKFNMESDIVRISMQSDDNKSRVITNATDSFNEYWANQFDQYILTGLGDEKIKTILERLKNYFVQLLNAYKEKGYNKDLVKYFDKIIDREQATKEATTEPAKTETTKTEANKVEVNTPPKDKTQLLMRLFSRLRKYSEPLRQLETLQMSKGLNADQAQVLRDQIREGKVALRKYLMDVVGLTKDKAESEMKKMEKVMGAYSNPAEILKSYDAAREKKQDTPLTKIINELMASVDKKVEADNKELGKPKPEAKTVTPKTSAKPSKVVGIKGTRGRNTMTKFKALFNGDIFRMIANNNMSNVGQVAELLKKFFPDVVLNMDQESFDNLIATDPSVTKIVKKGQVIGGVNKGLQIFINPSAHFDESEIFDTLIHEYGHVWQNFLGTTEKGRKLYNLGIELIREAAVDDAYVAEIFERQMKQFDGDEARALRETMAIIIGNKGSEIVNKSIAEKVKNWLYDMWSYIKESFKMSKDLTVEDIQNMTLNDFINTALADMLGGEKVKITDEQLADFAYYGEAKTTNSIHSIISEGRNNGFSDSSIREVLKKRGFSAKEINDAMIVQVDVLTPELPDAFGDVEGGVPIGLQMFIDVRDQLNKYANTKDSKGKTPTMSDVRQKAIDLLSNNETFKKQTTEVQMRLLTAMDNTLNTRANKDIQSLMNDIKLAQKNREAGKNSATAIKKKMRDAIKEKISKIDGITTAEVNKLNTLVANATEANMIASLEKLETVMNGIDKRLNNEAIKEQLRDIRNELRLQRKGANDLRTLQTYMKNMLRSTLPLVKYTRGDVKRIMAAIVNLNAKDFTKQMGKVEKFVKDKLKRAMLETIVKYGKKAKTNNNKGYSNGLDAQGQTFFNTAARILKAALANDMGALDEYRKVLKDTDAVDEAIAAYANQEELTMPQQKIIDTLKAFELFGDINQMSIPDLQDRLKSLQDERSASVARLSANREARAAVMNSLKFDAQTQIRNAYPSLYKPDGTLKSESQLRAEQESIWESFKKLKIWDGIKKFAERVDFQKLNIFRDTYRNWLSHIGALCEILDKGEGNFFSENFYDRLNASFTSMLGGIYKQQSIMDSIASSILGDKKKYKDLFKMIGDVKPVEYVKDGYTYALTGGKMARIYALSLNATQRRILVEQNGISEAKLAEIKDALGPQITVFVDSLVDYLSNDYFNSINSIYKKMFDVNLGYIANYFPTITEQKAIDAENMLSGDIVNILAADNQSALKERSNMNSAIDLDVDFRSATEHYFASMERFKAYAENARIISNLLADENIKTLLEQTGLKGVFTLLASQAISPTPKNIVTSKLADWMFTSFTGAKLLFKPIQLAKQASSIFSAFADYRFTEKGGRVSRPLDYIMWTLDVAKVMFNPKKYVKMMTALSPDYKERLQSLKQGDLLALEAGLYNNAKKYDETLAQNIRSRIKEAGGLFMLAGDTISTFGYIANYMRDIENGMSQEAALKKFANYNAALQTRRPTEKVALQYEANVLVRSQTLFMTAFYANINKVATSQKRIMRSIVNGKMPSSKDLRTFMLHVGVANAMSELISNAFLLGSDDDEDKEKAWQRIKDMMSGLGLLYQVPLFGAALELAVAKARGEQNVFTSGGVNPLVQLITAVSKGIKDDDLREEIKPIANFIMGISTDPFVGLYDYLNGDDSMDNVYEMLGISKSYRPEGGNMTDEDLRMIDEDLWKMMHPESEDKDLKEQMAAPEQMVRQAKRDAYGYSSEKNPKRRKKSMF